MATEEPALTMKEAVMEVRADVKAILQVLPLKSDKTDNILLERRVESLEVETARRKDIEEIKERLALLEKSQAVSDGVTTFKKWIVGLGVTVILTLLGLIGSVVIKLLPIGQPHHP